MATNFGEKIVWQNDFWRIAEFMTLFTLAVENVLGIIIFIAKWLIERAENLTGP